MLPETLPSAILAVLKGGDLSEAEILVDSAREELLATRPTLIQAALDFQITGLCRHSQTTILAGPNGALVARAEAEADTPTVREVLEQVVGDRSLSGWLSDGQGELQRIDGISQAQRALLQRLVVVPVEGCLLLSDFLATPGWTPDANWFFSRVAGRQMAQELMTMPEDERQRLVSATLAEVIAGLNDPDRQMQHRFYQTWRDTLERGAGAVVQGLTGMDDNRSQEIRCSVPRSMASRLLPPKDAETLREGVQSDLEQWQEGNP